MGRSALKHLMEFVRSLNSQVVLIIVTIVLRRRVGALCPEIVGESCDVFLPDVTHTVSILQLPRHADVGGDQTVTVGKI